MNNKLNVGKLLKLADKALNDAHIVSQDDKIVMKEYDGYIAGFGPTVINMGIKAALAFYMKDVTEQEKIDKPYRSKVVTALLKVIQSSLPEDCKTNAKLLEYVLSIADSAYEELFKITRDLSDASVALKLMVRTYKFSEKSKS